MTSPDRPARTTPFRVLVVEDEMLVAILLGQMLHDLGHQVVATAAHLDEAFEMAQQVVVDFAILDVNLDGKEIFPVADALAARNIPFAFSTGHGQERLREPYRLRPLLQKPFQEPDLQKIISQVFSSKSAR
jgi:CheY-like chemotaxis protein